MGPQETWKETQTFQLHNLRQDVRSSEWFEGTSNFTHKQKTFQLHWVWQEFCIEDKLNNHLKTHEKTSQETWELEALIFAEASMEKKHNYGTWW